MNAVLDKFDIDLAKLCSVTTDGAPTMVGKISGFTGHLKSYLQDNDIQSEAVEM